MFTPKNRPPTRDFLINLFAGLAAFSVIYGGKMVLVKTNKKEQVCSDNVCIQFGSSLHLKTILLIILTHKSFMMMKTHYGRQDPVWFFWEPLVGTSQRWKFDPWLVKLALGTKNFT